MEDSLFPDEDNYMAKKMRDVFFWSRMNESFFNNGSPFAVWSEVRHCRRYGLEIPSWVMDELDRIAESILKVEQIKGNNYGEFLSELLNLNGDKNKTARKNRAVLSQAFKISHLIGVKKRDLIIDDLINIDGFSERQAKDAFKWAKEVKKFYQIASLDPSECSPAQLENMKESIKDLISKLPK